MSLAWYMIAVVIPLILGVAFVPLWVWLKLPLPRQTMGRIMFILGQIIYDGAVMVEEAGDVVLKPFDAEKMQYYDAGEWHAVDEENVYRTGWRPLAIVPDVSEAALREYVVEETPVRAQTDGGVAILDLESGGYPLASEYAGRDTDGLVIDAVRYVRDIGNSGNRLLNKTEMKALRKYGGDDRFSDMMLLGILGGGFFAMFVTTWFMLGL